VVVTFKGLSAATGIPRAGNAATDTHAVTYTAPGLPTSVGLKVMVLVMVAVVAVMTLVGVVTNGTRLKVASTLAYDEFLNTLNWPLGAVVAVLLLVGLIAIIVGANRLVERRYAEVFR